MIKRTRRTYLVASALGIALAAIAFAILYKPSHRITAENCELIKSGMTEREVEQILGVPYGQYYHGTVFIFVKGVKGDTMFCGEQVPEGILCTWVETRIGRRENVTELQKAWIAQECMIYVLFDTNGNVTRVLCNRDVRVPDNRTILERWYQAAKRLIGA